MRDGVMILKPKIFNLHQKSPAEMLLLSRIHRPYDFKTTSDYPNHLFFVDRETGIIPFIVSTSSHTLLVDWRLIYLPLFDIFEQSIRDVTNFIRISVNNQFNISVSFFHVSWFDYTLPCLYNYDTQQFHKREEL